MELSGSRKLMENVLLPGTGQELPDEIHDGPRFQTLEAVFKIGFTKAGEEYNPYSGKVVVMDEAHHAT